MEDFKKEIKYLITGCVERIHDTPEDIASHLETLIEDFDEIKNHDVRDRFAAEALNGIMSNPDELKHIVTDAENDLSEGENIANHAYYIAIAMTNKRLSYYE